MTLPFTSYIFQWKHKQVPFLSFPQTDMTQVIKILPPVRQGSNYFTSQYHGCWWPGNDRSQGIGNYHDTELNCNNLVPAY